MRLLNSTSSFALRRVAGMHVDDPAAAAAAAAAAAGGGGGTPPPAFADTLPEDIRADPVFKDIKDLPGLAKSYHSAAKMVGMDKGRVLALPGDDDPKNWDGVYKQLGRPDAADKYELPKRGEDKDYTPEEQAFQKAILPVLHEAGLSQRQVAAIVPKWNAMMDAAKAAADQKSTSELEAAGAALKKEFGAAYPEKMNLAQSAIQHLSEELKLGDALTKELTATGLGNNPALAKLFVHIGAQLKEDGLIGKGGSGSALSPTEAAQQINAKQADKEFMAKYGDKRHPGHADAVAEMQRLYEAKAAKAA